VFDDNGESIARVLLNQWDAAINRAQHNIIDLASVSDNIDLDNYISASMDHYDSTYYMDGVLRDPLGIFTQTAQVPNNTASADGCVSSSSLE
jgi:hypothetical protein